MITVDFWAKKQKFLTMQAQPTFLFPTWFSQNKVLISHLTTSWQVSQLERWNKIFQRWRENCITNQNAYTIPFYSWNKSNNHWLPLRVPPTSPISVLHLSVCKDLNTVSDLINTQSVYWRRNVYHRAAFISIFTQMSRVRRLWSKYSHRKYDLSKDKGKSWIYDILQLT